jgi:lipoate-protein ligase A
MGEKQLLVLEKNPRAPSENLAVNNIYSDLVRGGKLDFIARLYSHTAGIILGNTQSLFDIRPDICHEQNYEVVRRPTGGSAIPVDTESTLCYSLFFKTKPNNLDLTKIYKSITIPLAKNLGSEFSVEGTYYLRYIKNGISYPIAGHAMRSGKGVIQFDGVINLTQLDVDLFSKMIKLRELYKIGESNFIRMDGVTYNLRGKEVPDLSGKRGELLISEEKQLRNLLGLYDLRYSKMDFISALEKTVREVFGEVDTRESYSVPDTQIKQVQEDIKKGTNRGKKICLGHCFIDMLEPEPKIHYRK